MNNGNGSFAPAVNYNAGGNPKAVAVGDLNGDGKLDLVVANFMKTDGYEALVLDPNRSLLGKAKNKMQLARMMVDILKEKL